MLPSSRGHPSRRGSPLPTMEYPYGYGGYPPQPPSYSGKSRRIGSVPHSLKRAGAVGGLAFLANQAIKYYRGSKKKGKAKRKNTKRDMGKKTNITSGRSARNIISRLKTMADNDTGTHILRKRQFDRVISSVNTQTHGQLTACSSADLETALTNLKYYDPSTPGTLITADGATGTFQHKFLFETVYTKMEVCNNYLIPAQVTIYLCTPKSDTSIAPLSAFTTGLADIGTPSSSNCLVHITDSPVFRNLWNIKSSVSRKLKAGQSMTLSHTIKDLMYDTSYNDAHASTYKPLEGAHVYVIRVEGVRAHDKALDEQGIAQAGIDYTLNQKFVIKYNAGGDLFQLEVSDGFNAFTNGAVTGAVNNPDNVEYDLD